MAAPGAQVKMPVVKLDPTRYDKSVEGILKGRNAAMFVNVECKKRGWEVEFEQVNKTFARIIRNGIKRLIKRN